MEEALTTRRSITPFPGAFAQWASFVLACNWVLGYAVWVLYAYRLELGWVDPWEMKGRAMLAGVCPTAFAGCIVSLWVVLRFFWRWLRRELTSRERLTKTWLVRAGFILCAPLLLASGSVQGGDLWPVYLAGVGSLSWLASSMFSGKTEDVRDKVLLAVAPGLVGSAISLALLAGFCMAMFPKLPEEFGGPGRRCIVLKLEASKLVRSKAEFLRLTTGAFETAQLELILETSRWLFVRHWDPVGKEVSPVRLNQSAIVDVSSCAADG